MNYEQRNYKLHMEDCRTTCVDLLANSIDTIICDPPYGLKFMGKDWDHGVPGVDFWRSFLRIAKPGAMLLAFGGTRTEHRLTTAIEDAGWEIRDKILWIYGSGFPKSHDISRGIDKEAGVEFSAKPASGVGFMNAEGKGGYHKTENQLTREGESTDLAKQWNGYGTALKPACEYITLAMKPLEKGLTFAQNAVKWGVGGLWIDGARVGTDSMQVTKSDGTYLSDNAAMSGHNTGRIQRESKTGRWPTNVILTYPEDRYGLSEAVPTDIGLELKELGCFDWQLDEQQYNKLPEHLQKYFELLPNLEKEEVVREFPEAGNYWKKNYGEDDYRGQQYKGGTFGGGGYLGGSTYSDSGSAARFFYCAKASRKERGPGNNHPTIKPIALMEYLCKLTRTPTGGVVFDPFMGTGTTGIGAAMADRSFVGCEIDAEHFTWAEYRVGEAYDESTIKVLRNPRA